MPFNNYLNNKGVLLNYMYTKINDTAKERLNFFDSIYHHFLSISVFVFKIAVSNAPLLVDNIRKSIYILSFHDP